MQLLTGAATPPGVHRDGFGSASCDPATRWRPDRHDVRCRRQSVRRIRRHDQTNPTRMKTRFLNGLLTVLFVGSEVQNRLLSENTAPLRRARPASRMRILRDFAESLRIRCVAAAAAPQAKTEIKTAKALSVGSSVVQCI